MNTKLLALLLATCEGIGIFRTFGGVRRVGSDDNGIQLDLNFYWPIRSSLEAKELDSVISGASAMYADRDSRDDDDPAKSDYAVTRKFQDDARHVTLNLLQDGTEGGRVILSDQSCSVVQAKVTTSKKAASFEVKVRVFGLTAKQVGDLAEGLTQRVGISLETDQAALFKEGGNVVALRQTIQPKPGQVVTGKLSTGAEFCGRVRTLSTDGLVEVEDMDDSVIEVSVAQVSSALTVAPPKGKTMEWVVDAYRTKAEKRGTRVSWAALVAALGEIHASDLTPTETWMLSSSVIEAASKIDTLVKALDEQDDDEDDTVPEVAEA